MGKNDKKTAAAAVKPVETKPAAEEKTDTSATAPAPENLTDSANGTAPAPEPTPQDPPAPPAQPAQKKRPAYRVKSPVMHDHKFYDIDSTIDTLTPEQAKTLCGRNIIEPVSE